MNLKALKAALKIAEEATTPERKALVGPNLKLVQDLLDYEGEQGTVPLRAYLFGSMASGKPNPSDIDLLVRYGKKVPPGNYSRYANKPNEVDMLTRLGKSAIAHVESKGQVHHIPSSDLSSYSVKGILKKGKEKYGEDYKWKRILGPALGVTAAGATLGEPEEAEAMPLRSLTRTTKKVLKAGLSSVSDELKGLSLEGKVIKEVRRGEGRWRHIIYTDGTSRPATTEYLTDLARLHGTRRQIEKFEGLESPESKLTQALKSMKMHEQLHVTGRFRSAVRQFEVERKSRSKELGEDLPDIVYVLRGRKYFQMPRVYAELLEKEGFLKVMKGSRHIPGESK